MCPKKRKQIEFVAAGTVILVDVVLQATPIKRHRSKSELAVFGTDAPPFSIPINPFAFCLSISRHASPHLGGGGTAVGDLLEDVGVPADDEDGGGHDEGHVGAVDVAGHAEEGGLLQVVGCGRGGRHRGWVCGGGEWAGGGGFAGFCASFPHRNLVSTGITCSLFIGFVFTARQQPSFCAHPSSRHQQS